MAFGHERSSVMGRSGPSSSVTRGPPSLAWSGRRRGYPAPEASGWPAPMIATSGPRARGTRAAAGGTRAAPGQRAIVQGRPGRRVSRVAQDSGRRRLGGRSRSRAAASPGAPAPRARPRPHARPALAAAARATPRRAAPQRLEPATSRPALRQDRGQPAACRACDRARAADPDRARPHGPVAGPHARATTARLRPRLEPAERAPLGRELAARRSASPASRGAGGRRPAPRSRSAPRLGQERRARPPRDGVGARTSAAKSASVTSSRAPRRNDRHAVRRDRAHHALVVERPQILERPAAAGQDRDRGRLPGATGRSARSRHRVQPAERGDDARRSALALDLAADQHGARQRPAPREHVAHVAPDGARGRRDDRDRRGPRRQRPLAAAVEQPLGREPRLELLEADRQVAEARRLEGVDVQLQRALRLEQVDPAVGDDLETRSGAGTASAPARRGTTRTGAARARP